MHRIFTFHNVSINTLGAEVFEPLPFLFTFHNVSINTDRFGTSVFSSSWFTFHNVSINTADFHLDSICKYNLHSTMFLLILTLSRLFHCSFFHLHSTMFLLIHRTQHLTPYTDPYLHSTMFLLIRLAIVSDNPAEVNLHSTMFLLILFPDCNIFSTSALFTFHNVSINTSNKAALTVSAQIYIPQCFY